ncbi:MAG: peptidylprolyl isomerase [Planctomycetes bacterium]|nr:peptidylprolyl isomerase [Planctomycetota bacterium]
MKTLITLASLPLLVLAACAKAQESATKPKQEPETQAQATKPAKDDKVTANDPAVKAIDEFIKKSKVDQGKPGWRTALAEPPKQTFSKDHDYLWHVETGEGKLVIRYLPDAAPMHVTSGIYLSRLGYYDGIGFHRIIPGFMAQGGCPNTESKDKKAAWGTGGPGFFMDGEFIGKLSHNRAGLLSMANTGRPKSEGSQFFITFGPTQMLDGKYTIWGEVVDGKETLKALEKKGIRQNNGMIDECVPIVRTWIQVVEKPKADEKPAEKEGEKKDGDK